MFKYIAAPFVFVIFSMAMDIEIVLDEKIILVSYLIFLGLYFLTQNQLTNFPWKRVKNTFIKYNTREDLKQDSKIAVVQLSISCVLLCLSFFYSKSAIFNLTVFCTITVYSLDCLFCMYLWNGYKKFLIKENMI